jgi:hypothetical protein
LQLDTQKVYVARIDSLPVTPMCVKLTAGEKPEDAAALEEVKKMIQNSGSASSYLKLVETIQEADYQVIARTVKNTQTGTESGAYLVTRKTDTQPLIKQEVGYTPDKAVNIVTNLIHIAKWNQTLNLENPSSHIPPTAVEIQVVHATTPELYAVKNGVLPFIYTHDGVSKPDPIRIKLVNKHSAPLYCSLMYMGSNFQTNPNLYDTGRLLLAPGQEAWARHSELITFSVDDGDVIFSGKKDEKGIITTVNERFKLIMSTVDFDPMVMRQQALGKPAPATRSVDATPHFGTRGSSLDDDDNASSDRVFSDWNTNSLTLSITRIDTTPIA